MAQNQEKFSVVTGKARTSFLNAFAPKIWEGETEGDYQCTFLFDTADDVKPIQEIVNKALAAEFGDNVPPMDMPWTKGDDSTDDDGNIRDGYEGKIVVRSKSKFKPTILDMKAEQMTDLDQDEFQSGDYARAKLETYIWTYAGKRGITLHLKVIQKLETGERFGGGSEDLSAFAPVTGGGSSAAGDLF